MAGARPAERVERLRRCAELAIVGAPWRQYPGIGQPGLDRIGLFTGSRAVLALDGQGHVYVCEFGNHRVQKFTLDGESLGCWGSEGKAPGELNNPWAVVRDTLISMVLESAEKKGGP